MTAKSWALDGSMSIGSRPLSAWERKRVIVG